MRTFFGIILGIFLTVGGAYLYDYAATRSDQTTTTTHRPMVNWDVVSSNWNRWTKDASDTLQTAWRKLESARL